MLTIRLWHWKILPYLPKSQLLAQWRELNSIFKKQDKHILINYIYEYDKLDLYRYSLIVQAEMELRGFKINTNNMLVYFEDWLNNTPDLKIVPLMIAQAPIFKNHHTDRYLVQCFYNLQEKYDRGQKDFDKETYIKLEMAVESICGLEVCNYDTQGTM